MRGHVIVGVMTISTDVDKLYDTDLTDAAWALIAPMLPAARPGGRPRKINIRAVLNAIFYLLRTGCQWRLLPREFPGWSTVYHYFRAWKNAGVWTCIQRSMYQQARGQAGRAAYPSVVIMDGQSVKTTERGGIRGFDAHKRVRGRKRHILWPADGRRRIYRHQLPDNQKIIKHPDRRELLFDRRLRAGHLLDIGGHMKRPDSVQCEPVLLAPMKELVTGPCISQPGIPVSNGGREEFNIGIAGPGAGCGNQVGAPRPKPNDR
jgi:transposase